MVIVGAIPAAVLVALAHLAALLASPSDDSTTPVSDPTVVVMAAVTHGVTNAVTRADAPAAPVSADMAPVDTRTALLTELQHGPATVADLVTRTGRSRSTIVGHLHALDTDGTIARDESKRYRLVTRPRAVHG